MASLNKEVSILCTSLYPLAKIILVLGRAALRLINGVIESSGLLSGAQHPIWFKGSSAKAPIIAKFLMLLLMGSVLFLFCNRTGHCSAWVLAAFLCLGSRIIFCL